MTRFYCLKCKKETETASEIQDITTNGRYRLHGDCVAMQKTWAKILESDDACKQCIDKCLKEAKKRKTD
ncbi:hypothetical protein GLOIN_2v1790441 [Rhizophagus irregularis DAOM 181602=DAOM 197198]|nr:hypothetical protein GLOIN_2v1790441 [Rhizophagus irregularis DAOM 181602=DAOM 197198]